MLRTEKMVKEQHLDQGSEDKNSSNWDCSEQG